MGGIGHLTTAIYTALFIAAGWIVIDLLGFTGNAATIARMVLIALALMGVGIFTYLKLRKEKAKQRAAKQRADAGEVKLEDSAALVDLLVKDAETRLVKSRLGREARLSKLPVFFLIGESGAAKTSIFIQSGVEPELLAGQVFHENQIVPTRPANFWYARSAVFVEVGGALLGDAEGWKRLVQRLRAKRDLASILGRKRQAPRGVIVCVDGEKLVRPGAEEALRALARDLHGRLGELSQILGVNPPVYALFTKADRVAYFTEFFSNLDDDEARQAFGSTLRLRSGEGVYGEEEGARLSAAFNELFYSLSEKRPNYLGREHDAERRPAAYEFPREFRKLRSAVTRFLVELCRPSQLRAGPLLRGFYFSGVRPVYVEDAAPAARAARSRESDSPAGDATGIFAASPAAELEPSERVAPKARRRRVPQWLFLGRLFNDVILPDVDAQGAGGTSVHARSVRRALVGGAAALLLFWSFALTVSYFNNRELENDVIAAARGIAADEGGGAGETLPSLDALERLDRLRAAAETLSGWSRDGAPWRLSWGLYVGDDLLPPTRRLYFNRFHQLLFGATQNSLLERLRALPARPGPADDYRPSYDNLKAYLITTSHHDKSTRDFLSPLLLDRWRGGRDVDPQRLATAQKQFDFYAAELVHGNPFSEENDDAAIERARRYLAQFNAVERIYQALLGQASEANPSLNFNRGYEGSAAYVVNNRDVTGAFSREGWRFMSEAIGDVRKLFEGERWVLGDEAFDNLETADVEPQLRERYRGDFLGAWREYLNNSAIARYASLNDAGRKLGQLSGNQSYLMRLFCLASIHTAVDDEEVAGVFQPLHFIQPPESCEEIVLGDNNRGYMGALAEVQTAVERVAQGGMPYDDQAVESTLNTAAAALTVARQSAQSFKMDPAGVVNRRVQKLMEDPITNATGILGGLGKDQLNNGGKRLCDEFSLLTSKYPFRSAATQEATIDEVNSIFRPGDGRLWSFYEASLRSYVERQGGRFVRSPDSKVRVTDAFLRFFNNAVAFSEALYPEGSSEPRLEYFMQALPAEGLSGLTLMLDGQTLKAGRRGGGPDPFIWPGQGARGGSIAGSLGGPEVLFLDYPGLWGVFKLFGDSDGFSAQDSKYRLDWIPRQGQSGQPIRLGDGTVLKLPFILDLKGKPPIFQKEYLAGFACVSRVAQ